MNQTCPILVYGRTRKNGALGVPSGITDRNATSMSDSTFVTRSAVSLERACPFKISPNQQRIIYIKTMQSLSDLLRQPVRTSERLGWIIDSGNLIFMQVSL